MITKLPDEPVALAPISSRIAVGGLGSEVEPQARVTPEDLEKAKQAEVDKAKYKIEVLFHRNRSSLAHKPSPVMVLIWESGRRLHGGGDEKMYWCGYSDCGMPFTSDNFAYMHAVCPACKKEQFLDSDGKRLHIKSAKAEGKDVSGLKRMPFVVGEKLANLTPRHLAELLAKTWYQLEGQADVYFKYSPHEIRYDKVHETTSDMSRLEKVRIQRKPGIYTLKRIRDDVAHGSDLTGRLLAMIVA